MSDTLLVMIQAGRFDCACAKQHSAKRKDMVIEIRCAEAYSTAYTI